MKASKKQVRPGAQRAQHQKLLNEGADASAGISPLVGISGSDVRRALTSTTGHLIRHPLYMVKHGIGYGAKIASLAAGVEERSAAGSDKRFPEEQWTESTYFRVILQAYFAFGESMGEWLDDLPLDSLARKRAEFVVKMILESVSPSNFLLSNPAALAKLRATRGGSVLKGLRHFIDDVANNGGMPMQVDVSKFRVGENLATTRGSVVFRNDILEVLQYAPSTATVFQTPLLVIPPQINKYYVLDLSPEKSLFRFLVELGFRVFAVSWRNPTPEQSHWGLDDYVGALLEAIESVSEIAGQESINLAGSCSGGITLAILSSYLRAQKSHRVKSLTLNVCVLDQAKEDSDVSAFASPESMEFARRKSMREGVLDGRELARVFSWMRPNDLVWSYVINNYLLGNTPPAFDVLYWNNDTTCLPGKLHGEFLDIVQANSLADTGKTTVLGTPIDLGAIDCDAYLVAGTTDHITPWRACFRTMNLLGGNTKFVLSNSGHIQALLNPPGNKKANFYVNNSDGLSDPDEWLSGATNLRGSWWEDWSIWLKRRSGRKVRAKRRLGSAKNPPLEAAPGLYVKG